MSIKHRNCWVFEYSKYNIHIFKPIQAQLVINKTTVKRTTCQCYHISRKRASNGPVQYWKKNENEDGAFLMNFREKGSFYRLILWWFRKWESKIQIIWKANNLKSKIGPPKEAICKVILRCTSGSLPLSRYFEDIPTDSLAICLLIFSCMHTWER